MGFFDKYKAENAGRKAYGLHVVGNRLYDQDKTAEAKAKHEQALKLYEEAIRGGCTKPSYVMAYGVLLLRFARFEEAKELFLKADSTPGITKAEKRQLRINFAICQWKLGQLDSAISNLKIAKAIRISRKCLRIVYQNIAFALAVKFLCLLLVALGAANMWAAIFADVGVMVLAVLNAIRALRE